jgi:hypothetical protein
MSSRGVFDPKIQRRRPSTTKAAPDAIAERFNADPAKALVMSYICQLAANGCAEWDMLDNNNGDIQFNFNTGEMLLLAERVIIRLA